MMMGNLSVDSATPSFNGGAMGGYAPPDWTAEEKLILQEGLSLYASDSSMIRCAKISKLLPDKFFRDVILSCRQMTNVSSIESHKTGKKSNKRRNKDQDVTRKTKEKRERVSGPSAHLDACSNTYSHARPIISNDGDDGISFKAIGGTLGHLLEQNAHAFNQISTNFTSCQYQENFNLLRQARGNIISMINNFPDMHDLMKELQPIPVKLDEGLSYCYPLSVVHPKHSSELTNMHHFGSF